MRRIQWSNYRGKIPRTVVGRFSSMDLRMVAFCRRNTFILREHLSTSSLVNMMRSLALHYTQFWVVDVHAIIGRRHQWSSPVQKFETLNDAKDFVVHQLHRAIWSARMERLARRYDWPTPSADRWVRIRRYFDRMPRLPPEKTDAPDPEPLI